MKRLTLLLPLLALAVAARAEDPAAKEAMESARLSEVEARILSLSTEPTEEEKRAVVSAVDALSENERIELTRRLPIVYGGQFVLDYLAHDSRKDVRLGVSLNRWTPKESLQFLCDDSEEDIRLSATNNLESVRVLRRSFPLTAFHIARVGPMKTRLLCCPVSWKSGTTIHTPPTSSTRICFDRCPPFTERTLDFRRPNRSTRPPSCGH